MWGRILGGCLIIGDILYVYHLGFNGAFDDFWTAVFIVAIAILGIALVAKG